MRGGLHMKADVSGFKRYFCYLCRATMACKIHPAKCVRGCAAIALEEMK